MQSRVAINVVGFRELKNVSVRPENLAYGALTIVTLEGRKKCRRSFHPHPVDIGNAESLRRNPSSESSVENFND